MTQTIALLPLKDVALAYTCDACKTKLVFNLSKTLKENIGGCPVCGEPHPTLRNALSKGVKFYEEAGLVTGGQLTVEIVIPEPSKSRP